MKKTLCIWMVLIGCVLLLMIPAFAEETSGSCGDGVTWSYDQNTATLTISGTGAVDDYGDPGYSISTHAPWNHIRGQIKKLVVENGVTYLGKFSTINMMSLREVYLADTVTELTPRQFENCPKLEKVELSQNLTTIGGSAFRSCTALKELHLPDSVEDVGSFAFAKCSSLEKITLPAGLTTIWDRLFLDCTSLRSVKIPAGVNVIWTDAQVVKVC